MRRKSSKPITHSRNSAKIVDRYDDLFTFREKPVSEAVIERIMQEAMQEAIKEEKVFKLTQYFRKRGIPWQTIKRWRDKLPWVDEAYQELLQAVGDNRELGALGVMDKKLDTAIVMFTMPQYDPDSKENIEWRASLKQDKDTTTNPVTVVIENYPVSEMVPEKK